MTPRRLLILGGTGEASALARLLADDPRFAPTLSLAGRTATPAPSPIPRRIGGFGGADGLARYLAEAGVETLVDATHPFAARITANAVQAAARASIPLLRLRRPPWPTDPAWLQADDATAAADLLGPAPSRVLLTVGRQDLAPFRTRAPHHEYWARSIDPPDPDVLPPRTHVLLARPPYALGHEVTLLARHRIARLVTKNAGGPATAAKLEAARRCGVDVVMIARPPEPDIADLVEDPHHALARLVAALGA